MLRWYRRWRRSRWRREPFSAPWERILRTRVPYYSILPAADQQELRDHIKVFLREKHFEGCGGLAITDEIRVTVAAQACVLLLHRNTDYYPGLDSILIYPRAYVAKSDHARDEFIHEEGFDARIGESWRRGLVVLSWKDVREGAADIHDGQNVVFHEFAHQLDEETGHADGTPDLGPRSRYLAWARVLGREYEALTEAVAHHRPTLLDAYGTESPAEFFAVATECFFEKPVSLRRRHPQLYEQLRGFYRQDPAAMLMSSPPPSERVREGS